MSLLVVGSVALDTVETVKGRREGLIGGSANYFSLAANHFTDVRMVGVVGEDYPAQFIDRLEERGVDTAGLKIEKGKTFSWGGAYSENFSERTTLFTHLNVFKTFQPELPDKYRTTEFVFLGNIHPALQIHVLDQLDSPKLVACDTMNLWINTTLDDLIKLIKRIDILLINDEEARMLSGCNSLPAAADEILKMGPETLIIKKGEHGAVLYSDGRQFFSPAYPVNDVADPTGAGDTFAGGFMGYLSMVGESNERHLRRAMVAGSTLASFCVEEFGVERLLTVTPEAINERFSRFGDLTAYDSNRVLE